MDDILGTHRLPKLLLSKLTDSRDHPNKSPTRPSQHPYNPQQHLLPHPLNSAHPPLKHQQDHKPSLDKAATLARCSKYPTPTPRPLHKLQSPGPGLSQHHVLDPNEHTSGILWRLGLDSIMDVSERCRWSWRRSGVCRKRME